MTGRAAVAISLSVFVLLSAHCDSSTVPLPQLVRPRPGPRLQAQVLTVDTNLVPENKAFRHLVVIAGNKARIGNELDEWRLFDFDNNTVTFVDDIDRSYRTQTFDSLLREKRTALSRAMPEFLPQADFVDTGEVRTINGFPAQLYIVRLGSYQRSLWMSAELNVPARLFPLMIASEPLTSPYAPAMAPVFEALVELRGTPVIDRSDMVWEGQPRIIEKKLVSAEQRNVPISWLQIPMGYRDLNPPVTP